MPVISDTSYEVIAKVFAELLQDVGERVRGLQGRVRVTAKGPADLVTQADELSHKLIRSALSDRYPGLPLVMEEQANAAVVPAHCIVVDELDGTHLFVHGGREYALTLALLEAGRPVVGVMHQPLEEQTVTAIRGQGAYLNGSRLALDPAARLADQLVMFEINRHLPERGRLQLLSLADRCLGMRCLGTAVGSAMDLLRGRVAAYVNWRGGKIWDFAAAALAIEEAGGVAVSCLGHALAWDQLEMSALFAANPALASDVYSCNSKAPPPGL